MNLEINRGKINSLYRYYIKLLIKMLSMFHSFRFSGMCFSSFKFILCKDLVFSLVNVYILYSFCCYEEYDFIYILFSFGLLLVYRNTINILFLNLANLLNSLLILVVYWFSLGSHALDHGIITAKTVWSPSFLLLMHWPGLPGLWKSGSDIKAVVSFS